MQPVRQRHVSDVLRVPLCVFAAERADAFEPVINAFVLTTPSRSWRVPTR